MDGDTREQCARYGGATEVAGRNAKSGWAIAYLEAHCDGPSHGENLRVSESDAGRL